MAMSEAFEDLVDIEEEAPDLEISQDPVTGEIIFLTGEEEEETESTFGENLADSLPEERMRNTGRRRMQEIAADAESRQEWLEIAAKGIKELGFDRDEDSRSDPFQGASGVVAPMFAQSCVDFQASAIKTMVPPQGPVRTQIIGA